MSDDDAQRAAPHGYPWPIVSADPAVQLRYEDMRADGQSHTIAEVLALRSFPGVQGTDAIFMQGRKTGGGQFEGFGNALVGAHHVQKARDAGVNPAGKVYLSGLARFPGDPHAWVSGRSDVKRVCEAEGWECSGAVKVDAPERPPLVQAPYRPAPDIVEREVRKAVAADPSLAEKDRGEVAHDVAARMAGRLGRT